MEVFNKELKNFLLLFFSLTYWFGVNGQTITEKDIKKLSGFLDKLGYHYINETNNEAYQFFLGS